MKRLQFFLAALFLLFSGAGRAEVVSSTELIADAGRYDGEKIVYRGEAIGEPLFRGNYAWLSVNDGANSLGVWLPAEQLGLLNYFGGHEIKGDTVEVRGIFHQSCPQHGGDLDIHAEEIALISAGEGRTLPPDRAKIRLSFYLALSTFLLMVVYLVKRRRARGATKFAED